MAERLIAAVLKTVEDLRPPGVRISLSPPAYFSYKPYVLRIGLYYVENTWFLNVLHFVFIRLYSQNKG